MAFFEGMRRRSQERNERARQEYEESLRSLHEVNAQVEKSERSLRFTQTLNAELAEDRAEVVRLEIQEHLFTTRLDGARARLAHLEKAITMSAQLKESQAVLARLKGEKPPVADDDYVSRAEEARKQVADLEERHRDISGQLTALRTHMNDREQELRKQFGLESDQAQ